MKTTGFLLVAFLFCLGMVSFSVDSSTPIYLEVPSGWPKPIYNFKNNPLTEEGFELGRNLFYDPILSRDNTISCSSCHLQQTGFAHVDHELSHGIESRIGNRNAPALINLAWNKHFHWDGGVNNLEVQAINPIENPAEMDEKMANVIVKLQQNQQYKSLFRKAFGDEKITSQRLLKALAQFTVMLQSSNSKYDQVIQGKAAFNSQEQHGYDLFKRHCATCHIEPLFSSKSFENNGLTLDNTLNDYGRIKITNNKKDSLHFKVPTLRNIQFTFPYMHDGRFKTLTEVIKHYNTLKYNPNMAPALSKPMQLNDKDRVDLVAFLQTLTDRDFLFNPRFGFPKK